MVGLLLSSASSFAAEPIAETTCQQLAPLPSGTCSVVLGDDRRLIEGDVLAPDEILRGGGVLLDANGVISCVGCDCAAQAAGATVITCPTGIVSPGLINSHDHITFAHNVPYQDTGERYEHRHDWRRGLNGHTPIPGITGGATGNEIRWGELRFLLGGATSTIGSGAATGVMRNLDRIQQESLGQPPVRYQTFPLGDAGGTQLANSCMYPDIDTWQEISVFDAYHPHVAEGLDAFAQNEFRCLSSEGSGGEDLLEPQSAFVHALGLDARDYAEMAASGATLVWSPRSNLTLYGDTAVVTAAHRLGVPIALGTDWIPTGSMNLQRELQCADRFNRDYLAGYFDDRELWQMVTIRAARAAAMDDAIGALSPGLFGDIAVFDARENQDYRAVIDADPDETVLVLRGGQALYGDDALIAALGDGSCDSLDVCGTGKALCTKSDIDLHLDQLTAIVGPQYPLFFCGDPVLEPSCHPVRSTSVNGSTVYSGVPTASDPDGDGIMSADDDCPLVFNPGRPMHAGTQADLDGDGVGDACDPTPFSDADADGVPDPLDNCTTVANPGQLDGNPLDDDDASIPGIQHYGDACDLDLDDDGMTGPADFFGVLMPCLGADLSKQPSCRLADLDGDGLVGASDFFGRLRPALGTRPGPGVSAPADSSAASRR